MAFTWTDIVFEPDPALVGEIASAWRWRVPDLQAVLVCSMFGGVFFADSRGLVHWLECGTGFVEPIADSVGAFNDLLQAAHQPPGSSLVSEWFLPFLVAQLHAAGKRPGPGQCYGLTILPIFKGGTYTVDNVFVLSAREWLTGTADLHRQIDHLPDGSEVRIKVVD